MATLNQWVAGARPRTLPAAVAPVLVGTAAAGVGGRHVIGYAVLALAIALALQVGVNYANDYSDGVRGTDAERVGPVRLVGQGLAQPANVKLAAFAAFGFAALAGLALVGLSGAWWLLPIGVLCVIAAWKYTGGDSPYGYRGLGEVFVFVFFGLVATLGTQYSQLLSLTWFGLLGAVGVGAIASAILVANNLRDIPTDEVAGKRTLAVRLGDAGTRRLWLGLIVVSVLCCVAMVAFAPWALAGLLALPLAWPAARAITGGATGRDLVPALGATGLYEIGYAVLITVGVIVGSLVG
ncbi:MAG: 1,4-dihydroxy-2-naphthoate polyprenyltransferase [Actinobacteria bacterium]|nr:1,4-dihydroxy-2-naphthoate polyprenyltransferase [Actinomycetota bacterium]